MKFRTSLAALLTLLVLGSVSALAAANITWTGQQGIGNDWDTGSRWSDGNPASVSAAANPSQGYELLPGSRMRSTASSDAVFPGAFLQVDGNGVYLNNPSASAPVAEIRFKPSTDYGTVYFTNLIMNGGQLNMGNDGTVVIQGKMTVLTNMTFYGNSASDATPTERGFQIDAQLTGTGTIAYYHDKAYITNGQYQTTWVRDLNITGTNNTFSGKWNVTFGALLGSGAGSLGTNDIIVTTHGVLETLYDVNNRDGSLFLDGLMYLHQDDTFKSVVINGTPLSAGKHTFAQLSAAYPTNFPATWTAIDGSTITNGAGSLTVLSSGLQIGQITSSPLGFSVTVSDVPPSIADTNTIALKLNGAAVTATSVTKTSGITSIGYNPPNPFPAGLNETVSLAIKDTQSPPVTTTANWQFTVPAYLALQAAWAKPANSGQTPGFSCRAIQIDQNATAINTIAWMEAMLSGQYLPVGGGLDNPQLINYYGAAGGGTNGNFANDEEFATAFNLNGGNNFAMEAVAYLALSPGLYTFGVSSDDGFRVTVGNYASDLVDMPGAQFGFGRAAGDTTWRLLVLANGLYPFRLAYWQGGGAYECEFYSVDSTGGLHLIGDPNDAKAIKAYRFSSALPANPIQITQQPANVSVQANMPATFAVGVSSPVAAASSMLFEWTHDGKHVAYGQTLTIPMAQTSDAGSYQCAITLLGYQPQPVASATATLTVTARTSPPTVASVTSSASANTVSVKFSEPVEATSAGTAGNYALSGGLSVSGAALDSNDPSGATVILTTGAQTVGNSYTLTINGVRDQAGNTIAANTKATFTGALANITWTGQEGIGNDWDTGNMWSDGQPASASAAANPAQGYELLPGSRMRSVPSVDSCVFPGAFLQVDGNGLFMSQPPATAPMAEIRFKANNNGTVYFTNLIMNGGQLNTGNAGTVIVQGRLTVLTNLAFYTAIASDTPDDRGFQVDAQLTGTGTISYYHDNRYLTNGPYQTSWVDDLNITGTNNTFTGKWNVAFGAVLGSGAGSLGTNDITVSPNGVLETLYDLNNPNGSLFLNGLMYLHQNDTFKSVVVNGTALSPGKYTFAQLNANFPLNFPPTWSAINGSTVTKASGSITVIGTPAAGPGPRLAIAKSGANLTISWPTADGAGFTLQSASSLTAPISWAPVSQTATTSGGTSSVSISATSGNQFFRLGK